MRRKNIYIIDSYEKVLYSYKWFEKGVIASLSSAEDNCRMAINLSGPICCQAVIQYASWSPRWLFLNLSSNSPHLFPSLLSGDNFVSYFTDEIEIEKVSVCSWYILTHSCIFANLDFLSLLINCVTYRSQLLHLCTILWPLLKNIASNSSLFLSRFLFLSLLNQCSKAFRLTARQYALVEVTSKLYVADSNGQLPSVI